MGIIKMRFLIITGMSGAGKTQLTHFLEDMGYYCIDNMPVLFLSAFAAACTDSKIKADHVAVVTDIRGGESFSNIEGELAKIDREKCPYEIVFLEADDQVLIRRYKETRRSHPLAPDGSIEHGINIEKELLSKIRCRADHIINTSNLLTRDLHKIVADKFGSGSSDDFFSVNIMSFGFKYSLPNTTDLVMDVRFLPNPYYIDDMRHKTGLDKTVSDYVTNNEICREFIERYVDLISYLVPYYIRDGRRQLTIAIGCTGGKHRSVAIAQKLKEKFEEKGITARVSHRDINTL